MALDLTFTPADFDSVITADDATEYFEEIILDIRRNSQANEDLIKGIQELEKYYNESFDKQQYKEDRKNIKQNLSNIIKMLDMYEKIKKVSMELRKKLSSKMSLELYDSIDYAFYYNNERFTTDQIDASWLIVGSEGELRLSLDKAIEDIKKDYDTEYKKEIQSLFNKHYTSYLNAISGMYQKQNKKRLGEGRVNKGVVAEAYEEHLRTHHSFSNRLLKNPSIENVADKAIIAHENQAMAQEYWSKNAPPHKANEAWEHIRHSLGSQRGTVAGDVFNTQVKQGSNYTKYSSQVRLASLATLRDGIRHYCDILNTDIPAREVAQKIAKYMSEPVKRTSANLAAYAMNKEIAEPIGKLLHF